MTDFLLQIGSLKVKHTNTPYLYITSGVDTIKIKYTQVETLMRMMERDD